MNGAIPAKTRSKADFGLPPSAGILFLDHDEGGITRDDLWSLLVKVMPALATAGVVWRPSGSSHVCLGDRDLTQVRGQHFFGLIADASDGPRIIKILAARLWLEGHGHVKVSKAGSLLIRGLIDTAPSDAARLIFAGGADCQDGLEQRRGPPVILNRGGFLDSRALVPDLTAEEQGRYEALVEQAKLAAAPEASAKRAAHRTEVVAKRVPELMREGVPAAEAEARISAAVDAAFSGTLLSDFVLTVVHDDGRHEEVTVGTALGDRERWDGVDALDPINPTHRDGEAACRLYLLGTSPIAYSLDDGGQVWRLRVAQQRLVVSKGTRAELVSQLAALVGSDPRVFAMDTGPVLVERGKVLSLTVDRLMNLVGSLAVLVTKTQKGDLPTDLQRDVAALTLTALNT